MDQLSMFSRVEPMRSDKILVAIRPSIDETLFPFNLSPRHVSYSPLRENVGKLEERITGYSIHFSIAPSALADDGSAVNQSRGGIICRIKDQTSRTYLEFPINRAEYYKTIGEATTVGAANTFLRINLEAMPDIDAIAKAVCADIDAKLRVFPSDIACCDLYMQCSDAARCIAANQDSAVGCYYKRNLLSGKVFYGKNADQ